MSALPHAVAVKAGDRRRRPQAKTRCGGNDDPLKLKTPSALDAVEDDDQSTSGVRVVNKIFLKTKLCRFYDAGHCARGDDCTYAHERQELRRSPDLQKTKFCPKVASEGFCTNATCKYAHARSEMRKLRYSRGGFGMVVVQAQARRAAAPKTKPCPAQGAGDLHAQGGRAGGTGGPGGGRGRGACGAAGAGAGAGGRSGMPGQCRVGCFLAPRTATEAEAGAEAVTAAANKTSQHNSSAEDGKQQLPQAFSAKLQWSRESTAEVERITYSSAGTKASSRDDGGTSFCEQGSLGDADSDVVSDFVAYSGGEFESGFGNGHFAAKITAEKASPSSPPPSLPQDPSSPSQLAEVNVELVLKNTFFSLEPTDPFPPQCRRRSNSMPACFAC